MKTLFFSLLLCLSVTGYAQLHPWCDSDELHKKMIQSSPEYEHQTEEIEKMYRDVLKWIADHGAPEFPATYKIPVVFHVMHNPGVAVGTGSNISLSRIQTEIANWNAALARTGAYLVPGAPLYCSGCQPQGAAVLVDIEFVLATQDPLGFPTTGVNRFPISNGNPLYRDDAAIDFGGNVAQDMQHQLYWNSTQYFNVWVVDEICIQSTGDQGCGVAGYAWFPSAHGLYFDGAVVEDQFIGTSTDNSKVMVHEIGHYLNLFHTFEGGCAETNCTTAGDRVCDTPPDNSTVEVSCSSMNTANSCSNDNSITGSPYSTNVGDIYEDYMDYGFQSCQNTFTAGQKARMEAVMMAGGARVSLQTSPGKNAPTVMSAQVAFSMIARTAAENPAVAAPGGDCRPYRDITFRVIISQLPTTAATLTFSTGGTATSVVDYLLQTASVTFGTSGDLEKYGTIRIYDDAAVEGNETLTLTYMISGGATAAASNQTMTITLKDNDTEPGLNVYNYDFQGTSGSGLSYGLTGGTPSGTWSQSAFSDWCTTDQNFWVVGTNGGLTGTQSAYVTTNISTKPLGYNNSTGGSTCGTRVILDPLILTPSMNASSASGMTLSFSYKANGGVSSNDYGDIYYRFNTLDFFSLLAGGSSGPFRNNGTTVNSYSTPLGSTFNNQSVIQLAFNWHSDGNGVGTDPPFAIDNFSISVTGVSPESDLYTTSAYFGPSQTIFVYGSGGELMAKILNNSAHDFGCTTITIDRTGSTCVAGSGSYAPYYFTNKTFTVSPTNANAAASYTITLYYKNSEITGWASCSGQSSSTLNMIKTSGVISTATPTNSVVVTTTPVSYGSDWAYSGTFTGFSGFGLGNVPSGALPVELLSFDGKQIEENILLDWRTVQEINSDHFILERSGNGYAFEPLTKMAAAGQSDGLRTYKHLDVKPLHGMNYYRLCSVDTDGAMDFSKVVAINYEKATDARILPNPTTSDEFKLEYFAWTEGELKVEITDIAGKIIYAGEYEAVPGTNSYDLSLTGAGKGVYFVKTYLHHQMKTLRLVKM